MIRGVGSASVGTWPNQLADLPPNRAIVRTGSSGTGKVVEDNADAINDMLTSYNADVDSGMVAVGGAPGSAGGSATAGRSAAGSPSATAGAAGGMSDDAPGASPKHSGGGCNFAHGHTPFGASAAAAALVAVVLRRRRRR